MSHTIRFRMMDGTYHEVEVTDGLPQLDDAA
jgi:hypothetical protein